MNREDAKKAIMNAFGKSTCVAELKEWVDEIVDDIDQLTPACETCEYFKLYDNAKPKGHCRMLTLEIYHEMKNFGCALHKPAAPEATR